MSEEKRKKWEVQRPLASARCALLAFHDNDERLPLAPLCVEGAEATEEKGLRNVSPMDHLASFLPLPHSDIDAIPEDKPTSPKHSSKHSPRRFQASPRRTQTREENEGNGGNETREKEVREKVRRGVVDGSKTKVTPVRMTRRRSEPAAQTVDSSPSARIQTPSFSTTPNPRRVSRSTSMQTISFRAKGGKSTKGKSKSRANSRTK